MENKLIKFIKQHGFEALSNTYNIIIKPSILFPELVCLTYSQLNTPKNEVTNDCRGIIINKDTLEIVCYPFTRFSDYNPKVDVGFNKHNFKCYEKIDGSLMSVYFYKDKWRVSSKSTCDAHGVIPNLNITYSEYFWSVFNKLNYNLPTDKKCSYIFEFKFPSEIQFITKSETETITLIGIRNNISFEEYTIESEYNNGWNIPQFEKISFEEVLNKVNKLNPVVSEGFVVCDDNFKRLKIKTPAYDLIGLLKPLKEDETLNSKVREDNLVRLIQISQVSDYKDFIQYYSHCKDVYKQVCGAKKQLVNELNDTLSKIENSTPKEIGEIGKKSKFAKHLWQLQKNGDVQDFVANLDKRIYADYLKKYIN